MSEADLKRKISYHIYGEEEFREDILELISVIRNFELPIEIDNESDD